MTFSPLAFFSENDTGTVEPALKMLIGDAGSLTGWSNPSNR